MISTARKGHTVLAAHSHSPKGAVVLFGEILADVFPDRTVLGGAPFNVARHLKGLGENPVLISRLGHDALREEVLATMSANGMETSGIQCDNSRPTGRVKVFPGDGEHRFEILPNQAYDCIHPAVARMSALSANPSLVYFGTLAQRGDKSRQALKTLLRGISATKFLDINLRSPWYDEPTLKQSLQYADTLKLNRDELCVLAEKFELHGTSPHDWARQLLERFTLEQVVVTCGADGAWLLNNSGKMIEAGRVAREINMLDSVGAGDGFSAVSILGKLRRWPMALTLERANSFAAAICEIRGAVPDHPDFYQPFLTEWAK